MGLALDLEDYHPSVLLHCWLDHLNCKIVSKMTYIVSRGTLNPTVPYTDSQRFCSITSRGIRELSNIGLRGKCLLQRNCSVDSDGDSLLDLPIV